jgi:hypothetical protein
MKLRKRETIDVEVVSTAGRRAVAKTFAGYFFYVPPLVVPERPALKSEDLSSPFAHRVGVAVLYTIAKTECFLSPDGTLRVFLKILSRWFVALIVLVFVLGLPTIFAAQFVAGVAQLLEAAARSIFFTVCWALGTVLLIAIASAATVMFLNRKN